ncbi:MAG: copper chaperone PCu(A)C [Roseovarius sp.]|jgi:copper(I)-binding protein|uniref:copper chaperone PCu(A)C n=1 Tax=Roseovarius sp. TaxID=1486281 RepID=UPI0032EE6354
MSLKSTLFAALAGLTLAAPAMAQEIHVLDTYARSASPMAKTGAAFMLIENIGDAPDRLVAVKSPAAKKVELHTHREEGGVMKMVHVEEGFELGAGETLFLQRGGRHVMFMGLTEPFEQGKTIPLTLVFETSGEITLDIPVDLERMPKEGHGHGN